MYYFPFGNVDADEGGLRETSAKYILITSAALKEFPQIIFSAKQPLSSRLPLSLCEMEAGLPCAGLCTVCSLCN